MEQARILRVVVASPGDVQAERDAVERAAEEVSRNVGRDRGLRLEVYRWETEAHPGFHAKGPQGIIDPTLSIDTCDLLIAIFWKRFGTPTADGRTGTEHEFNIAYEAWKSKRQPQIILYFSQQPSAPPESDEEIEQWRQVLRFKKSLPKEALGWTYNGCENFEEQVRNHLAQFVRGLAGGNAGSAAPVPAVTPPSTTAPLNALHSLPPPPADFTGRMYELAELRAAIEQGGVTISGLQGQGGVGKTALALKLAEELSSKFPDAQLYLDLKGVSEKPVGVTEAMAFVIRAWNRDYKAPEGMAELEADYRSVLHGKRALLLMDNARDAAQVRPLLPPKPCALLVTSRQHFALPGLQAKDLNTLPPPDAEALLLAIAPRINGHASTVAQLCGYLPQALRLAAGALVERPSLDPAEYARRLSDEKKRLELLQSGNQSMAASIELSYGLLDAEIQRRWRALGVFPDTFDVPAAAAVWALEGDAAQDALDRLLQHSMVEWNDKARRYRLHDLMHDFARDRLAAPEREQAAHRHAAYYAELLAAADELYKNGGTGITQGLALFDLEWVNVRAGQSWAAGHARQDSEVARLCSDYPSAGVFCLDLRLHPRDLIQWLEAALAAARGLRNRKAEAAHLGNLGLACWNLDDTHRAIEFHKQHLTLSREIGDLGGEGGALNNLGLAYRDLGDTGRAIESYERALVIQRKILDRQGEGNVLGNLGLAHAALGEIRNAVTYYEQQLAIARETGDRVEEGTALGNLGNAYAEVGDIRRAIDLQEQYLAIASEVDHRRGKANALGSLGAAYFRLGEARRAIEYHNRALAINQEIGNRRGEGDALFGMSLAMDKLGERQKAIEEVEAALEIREQIEDPNAAKVRKQLEEWKG